MTELDTALVALEHAQQAVLEELLQSPLGRDLGRVQAAIAALKGESSVTGPFAEVAPEPVDEVATFTPEPFAEVAPDAMWASTSA